MLDGLGRGVHAFMPTGLHRAYVEICRRFAAGDREGAAELFARLRPILDFSNQGLDISIRFFKRLLWRQGVYATPAVREPLAPFPPGGAEEADRLIDTSMAIEAELGGWRGAA